jgi:hypothetical protein
LTGLRRSPRIDGMFSRGKRRAASPRARAAGLAWLALVALALPVATASAEAKDAALYQWTDERGNVRYTPDPDRVPSDRRGTLLRLEPGMPAPPPPPRPVAAPAPTPAAGADTHVDADTDGGEAGAAPVAPGPAVGSAAPLAPAGAATPSSGPSAAPPPLPPSGAGDTAREQQLAAAIAADQEALKALIAAQAAPGEAPLADSAELREIAQRLPRLQAELRALRERRAPAAQP